MERGFETPIYRYKIDDGLVKAAIESNKEMNLRMGGTINENEIWEVNKMVRDEYFGGGEVGSNMYQLKGQNLPNPPVMTNFDTGATRSSDVDKYDYEGFMSPLVVERYAKYLHKNRIQADGKVRDSDNWQKGMPLARYIKSAWRHFMSWWKLHRGYEADEDIEDAICALIFNANGYLHERLKSRASKVISHD